MLRLVPLALCQSHVVASAGYRRFRLSTGDALDFSHGGGLQSFVIFDRAQTRSVRLLNPHAEYPIPRDGFAVAVSGSPTLAVARAAEAEVAVFTLSAGRC
jgi:hypothetical protein